MLANDPLDLAQRNVIECAKCSPRVHSGSASWFVHLPKRNHGGSFAVSQ